MDDGKLIEFVRNRPCLYDKTNVDFKDRNKKQQAWCYVAKSVGLDENAAMKRWGNLRERFSKELRGTRSPSGSGASVGRQWAHFESLQFLKSHIIPRPMRQSTPAVETNFSESEILDVSAEVVTENPTSLNFPTPSENSMQRSLSPQPASSAPRKKKRQLDEIDSTILETVKTFKEVCARREEVSAEISGFGIMICAAISKLSSFTQALVMRRCTDIVMQAQIDEGL